MDTKITRACEDRDVDYILFGQVWRLRRGLSYRVNYRQRRVEEC